MEPKNQLDSKYQTNGFFRHRLLSAIEVPAIKVILRDRMLQTSHQAVKRVETQKSDKANSVGSSTGCVSHEEIESSGP